MVNFFRRKYVYRHWSKHGLAFCFDLLGSLLFLPMRLLLRPLEASSIRSLLVIRADHIGDAVMAQPAILALHNRFPHAKMDFLVSPESAVLFEDMREVREILPYPHSFFARGSTLGEKIRQFFRMVPLLRERHYDLAIDFRGDLRHILMMTLAGIPHRWGYGGTGGGFLLTREEILPELRHQVYVNLKLLEPLGISPDRDSLSGISYSSDKKYEFWRRFEKKLTPVPETRIVIHPGAGVLSKRWPAEKFKRLIEKIKSTRLGQIIVIGSEQEKGLFPVEESEQVLDLRGQTTLCEIPILMDASDIFIGNDSGPAHLAAAQGLEVIVLFSGTNRVGQWRPWTKKLKVVDFEVPCSPCYAIECPLRHHDCMEKIEVQDVLLALEEIVVRRKAGRVS